MGVQKWIYIALGLTLMVYLRSFWVGMEMVSGFEKVRRLRNVPYMPPYGNCITKNDQRTREQQLVDDENRKSCSHLGPSPLRLYLKEHYMFEFLSKRHLRGHLKQAFELQSKSREWFVGRFDEYPVLAIRGLMSSGTNWVRFLLNSNCKNANLNEIFHTEFTTVDDVSEAIYGWKHGFLDRYELTRISSNPKHKMILVTRDAMTWTTSMRRMLVLPGEVGVPLFDHRNAMMADILKQPFSRICKMEHEWYYRHCLFEREQVMLRAKNLLDWRTKMYGQFYNLSLAYPDKYLILRYEDLRDDLLKTWQNQIVHKTADIGLGCRADVRNTNARVKYRQETEENFNMKKYEIQTCVAYGGGGNDSHGEKAFQFLKNNLDLDLEKKLGYVYYSARQHCV